MKRNEVLATTDVFHAIADPTRRDLLALVAHKELPVKELAQQFAMTRPAISQHLRILLEAGLVIERRAGRERLYRLQAEPLREISEWVHQYEQFWHDHLDLLGSHLEQRKREHDVEQYIALKQEERL
jgi:DNA-binding transcriptional ArsR family regulator